MSVRRAAAGPAPPGLPVVLARTDDDRAPGNLRCNHSDVIPEIDKTARP